MIDSLADSLSIQSASLNKLGLGWVPIVQFKNGPNYQGWWTIPERDASGQIIGLSLRSPFGRKIMYPGSKHGLIYAINPDHSIGHEEYEHGPQNWLRTINAGVDCPICGKPDGCLVSVDDPDDPQAVVCIRIKEGSTKPLKFGWLHIRKPEGYIQTNSSLLLPTDNPIIVVEGMTDVGTALDLGLTAVGRPSNLSGMDLLADLLRGKKAIVLGENDKKANGSEPGREGMIAAFQILKHVTKHVKMCMPPEHVKDLRHWYQTDGLTQEQLLDYIKEHGSTTSDQIVLDDDRPYSLAIQFLDDEYRMAGRHLIKRWNNAWYLWDHNCYKELAPELLESAMYPWAHKKQVMKTRSTGESHLVPLNCNISFVTNLTRAISACTIIDEDEIPCWINDASGPSPKDVIVFANGILDVSAHLNDDSESLLSLTPDFFTTAALPYNYDPTARCPIWRHMLRESLGHDQDCIRLLREWFGYCLVPDISFQKMMFFRGPSGAGKSVIINVLKELVGGEERAASPTFERLTGEFGLQALIGKLIVTIGDARNVRGPDAMRGLETLLNITGGDSVQINRKFKDVIGSHKLFCRITMASNEFPELPDHAGAMLRRLNIIEFKKSYVGHEDFALEDKLKQEIPGIAVWALQGLYDLRQRGYFILPQSSRDALNEWRTSTSPMAAFLEECTEQNEEAEIQKEELFNAWTRWSVEKGIRPLSRSKCFERLRSAAPYLSSDSYQKGGHKFSIFKGLRIKPWARKQYLGEPLHE